MDQPRWTTADMAEAMMITTSRLSRWMTKYGIEASDRVKGSNYRHIRLFTDEQFITILRAYTLSSKGYQPAEIRNIIELKGNTMKIDRLKHPILTYPDMDAFVNQLSELEVSELVRAMEQMVINKRTVDELKAKLSQAEEKASNIHEHARNNHKSSVELMAEIEEIKQKIEAIS